MTQEELNNIRAGHRRWIYDKSQGKQGDLRGADLRELDIRSGSLSTMLLEGATFPSSPIIKDLDQKILDILDGGEGDLEMEDWHYCGTTHCIGGWAIYLAGEEGQLFEERVGSFTAAVSIYFNSTGVVPDFYCDNEEAMDSLRDRAEG